MYQYIRRAGTTGPAGARRCDLRLLSRFARCEESFPELALFLLSQGSAADARGARSQKLPIDVRRYTPCWISENSS